MFELLLSTWCTDEASLSFRAIVSITRFALSAVPNLISNLQHCRSLCCQSTRAAKHTDSPMYSLVVSTLHGCCDAITSILDKGGMRADVQLVPPGNNTFIVFPLASQLSSFFLPVDSSSFNCYVACKREVDIPH